MATGQPPRGSGLEQLALQRAEAQLKRGDPEGALKWLQAAPQKDRPKSLEANIRYALCKVAAGRSDWRLCDSELANALRLDPQPLYQRKLELVRRRPSILDDRTWKTLHEKVDSAKRLPPQSYLPDISSVWTCGAYHSRGHNKSMPWTKLLRLAKEPQPDPDEAAAISKLACGFLCRHLVTETPLQSQVDVVVSIPPDASRYARRGMSLPDQLADAIEAQLAIPCHGALRRVKSIELRGLTRAERRREVEDSMAVNDVTTLQGRTILVVDDVTTSGATLLEAARILRAAGTGDVHAITLCHTEG
jgi:hypothetical protein